jgi:hypothetical protein
MGLGKELFIAAHEELIEEYLEAHPDADWGEAYEKTADAADGRSRDKYADMVDAAKQRAKDAGNWPPKPRSAP